MRFILVLFVSICFSQNKQSFYFDFDESTFNSIQENDFQNWLKSNPTISIKRIEGYCDSVGTNQYNKKLDLVAMERGLKYLEGEHNFKSFTKSDDDIVDYVRKISTTSIVRDSRDLNKITISFVGTGFLRYMVRNMVGLLIEIGEGKRNPEEVIKILEKEDRTISGKTANPEGLYLKNVFY